MYIAGIIIVSSLLWVEKKPVLWRFLHYGGYLLVLLVFLHALYLGTDLKQGVLRIIWFLIGGAIFIGVVSRMYRAGTIHKGRT